MALTVALLAFTGCNTSKSGGMATATATTATITLSGAAGTPFTGFYIQDGQRVAVSAVLPWTFHGTGVSTFEFQKISPGDVIAYEFIRDGGAGGHSVHAGSIAPGVSGVHCEIHYRSMKTRYIDHHA